MTKSPRMLYRILRRDMEEKIRNSERLQEREEGREEALREGRLETLLDFINKGLLTDETVIESYAKDLGYTLEQIKQMTSNNNG